MSALSALWRFRFSVAIGVLTLMAALWFRSTVRAAEERGRLTEQTRVLDSTLHALALRKAKVDTLWRTESTTFTRWRTQFLTTPPVVFQGVPYVRKDVADSTVAAGARACEACARAKAVSDSIGNIYRVRAFKAESAARVPAAVPMREKAKWAAIGAATLALLSHFKPHK